METCIWDLLPDKTQSSLYSYENKQEYGNPGSNKLRFYYFRGFSNKYTDQIGWTQRLVCACGVHMQQKQVFLQKACAAKLSKLVQLCSTHNKVFYLSLPHAEFNFSS